MASTEERKAAQRKRDRELGFVRVELRIEQAEAEQLDELCSLFRPGNAPYTRPELFGLLIRKAYREYEEKLAEIPRCEKCGEVAPVAECSLSGDSECWRYYGPQALAYKI